MAISIGKKAEEQISTYTRYIGIAPVYVLAVNPNRSKLQELRGFAPQEEPEYTGENEGVKLNNITFVVKTDSEFGNSIDTTELLRFYCTDEVRRSRDNEKVLVIDKYGETIWVNKEEYKAQTTRGRVVGPYKPCHRGEAELITFLKAWLNIPDSTTWNKETRVWEPVKDLSACECSLDWSKIISGNMTDINNLIKSCNDYKVKVCFGIRTTDENRHYPEILNRFFLKNSSSAYYRFDNKIKEFKEAGLYANTEFSTGLLHEWSLDKTVFEKTVTPTPAGSDIFGNQLGEPEVGIEAELNKPAAPVEKEVQTEVPDDDLPF